MRRSILCLVLGAAGLLASTPAHAQLYESLMGPPQFRNGLIMAEPLTGYICSELTDDIESDRAIRGTDAWSGRERLELNNGPMFAGVVFQVMVLPNQQTGRSYLELDLGGGAGAPVLVGTLDANGRAEVILLGMDEFGSNPLLVTYLSSPGAGFPPPPPFLSFVHHFGLNPQVEFALEGPTFAARGKGGNVRFEEQPAPKQGERFSRISQVGSLGVDWRTRITYELLEVDMKHSALLTIDYHNSAAEQRFLQTSGTRLDALFGAEQEMMRHSLAATVHRSSPRAGFVDAGCFVRSSTSIQGYPGLDGLEYLYLHLHQFQDPLEPGTSWGHRRMIWPGFDPLDGQTGWNLFKGTVDLFAIKRVRISVDRSVYTSGAGVHFLIPSNARLDARFTGSRLILAIRPLNPFGSGS